MVDVILTMLLAIPAAVGVGIGIGLGADVYHLLKRKIKERLALHKLKKIYNEVIS